MEQKPESPLTPHEAGRWMATVSFGLKHAEAVRSLLDQSLGLTGEWRNVARHCMTAGMVGEELAKAAGLSPEETSRIAGLLVLHDAKKRVEIQKGKFTDAQKEQALQTYETAVSEADPDGMLRKALSEDNRDQDSLTLAQAIVRVSDNFCMEENIAPASERLDEVRRRREAKGQDLRKEFGSDYWERELAQSMKHIRLVADAIRAQGHDVDEHSLPGLLIRRFLSRTDAAAARDLGRWASGGVEMLGRHFYTQTVADTPREDKAQDEDRAWAHLGRDRIDAIVLDGATDIDMPAYFKELGKKPGWIAADEGMKAAKSTLLQTPVQSPESLMLAMNEGVRGSASSMPISTEEKSRIFSACALTVSIQKCENGSFALEYANLGDCALLIRRADGTYEWVVLGQGEDGERNENFTAYEEVLEKRTTGETVSMKDVLPRLRKDFPRTLETINNNRLAENTVAGEGCSLKGSDPDALKKCLTVSPSALRLKSGDTVFLMTDGALPWVTMDLEQRKHFVEEALESGGPVALMQKRRELAEQNADQEHPPCLKQRDDLRIVAVRVL